MSDRPFPVVASPTGESPPIEVRPQHRMPLGRSLALCWKGIGHRLLRSLLTLAVIVLAVAFFMTLLGDAAYSRAVESGVTVQRYQRRAATRRLSTWFMKPDPELSRVRVLSAREHPGDLRELAELAMLPLSTMQDIAERMHDEARVVGYLADLDAGTRAILVGGVAARDVLDDLQDPTRFAALTRTLTELPALRLPASSRGLAAIVRDHPAQLRAIADLGERWTRRSHELTERLQRQLGIEGRAGLEEVLVSASTSQASAVLDALHASGFADTPASFAQVQAELRWRALERTVREELATDEIRAAWLRAYLVDPPLDAKMRALAEPRVLDLLAARHPRQELVMLAGELAREARLERLASTLRQRSGSAGAGEGDVALSGRRRLLLAVSFVVCLVGIANAMFMAITERFREIATMKCLGATDGFILQQFLIEALLHGAAGGVLGALVGALLCTIEGAVLYGAEIITYFPGVSLAASAGLSLVSGVALAMLASVAPSWSASRMAPMDAMRVE